MHGLKGHDLGLVGVSLPQQLPQVLHVIVAEDELLRPAVPDAHDHRGVVPCVRVDLTTWEEVERVTSGSRDSGFSLTNGSIVRL